MQYLLLGIFLIFPGISISYPVSQKNPDFNSPDRHIQIITNDLLSPDIIVQKKAIQIIKDREISDLTIQQKLTEMLSDRNPIIRRDVIRAFQVIPLDESIVPIVQQKLINALADRNDIVKMEALIALELQLNNSEVQNQIAELLLDSNPIVRWQAMNIIKKNQLKHSMDLLNPAAVLANLNAILQWIKIKSIPFNQLNDLTTQQLFAKKLSDSNPIIRLEAVKILGLSNPMGPFVQRLLAKALADHNAIVQIEAAIALRNSQVTDLITQLKLAAALFDPNVIVKMECARTLRFLRSDELIVQRKLAEAAVLNSNNRVQLEILLALENNILAAKNSGKDVWVDSNVPQQLMKILESSNPTIQLEGARMLVMIQPNNRIAQQKLADALLNPNAYIQLVAAETLKASIAELIKKNKAISSTVQQQLNKASSSSNLKVQAVVKEAMDMIKSQKNKDRSCQRNF